MAGHRSTVKKSDYPPGSFGCHEALHMVSFFAEAIDREVCQHPAINANPEWGELAQSACEALHDLYQKIGEVHLGKDERTETIDECAAIVRVQAMMPFTNHSAISALEVVADKIAALKNAPGS